ncbi:ribonuclease HII [Candidatus Woesearchaeota archaeon]|nr:ribonuclease HII [Candidatus Woesearchaeota archaeon]
MTLTLGIDEAGRGPCVASMFIVGTMFEENQLNILAKLGVKDSKMLTHERRIKLDKKIREIAKGIKIIKVEPKEIDDAVEGKDGLNLNWLEAVKQAEIINELKPDRVIIDCPSPNIKAYTSFLKQRIKPDLLGKTEFIVEHKADQNFLECSSASIVAKVMRNQEVSDLEKKYGITIGSGYPSDPMTQKFLKEQYNNYPRLFRKSWLPSKKQAKEQKQKSLADF